MFDWVLDTPSLDDDCYNKKLHLKCSISFECASETVSFFGKCCILDVWMGSRNASEMFKETFYSLHEYQ